MKKGKDISGEDLSLWEKVTRSVRPYPGKKVDVPEPSEEAEAENEDDGDYVSPQRLQDVRDILLEDKQRKVSLKPLSVGDLTALDKATAEKLRKGKIPIQGTLDLHGMTQKEASDVLYQYILNAYDRQKRCVLIITGKGRRSDTETGILQANVPRWLSTPGIREHILAITYAQAKDGGSGALYVMLRRIRG